MTDLTLEYAQLDRMDEARAEMTTFVSADQAESESPGEHTRKTPLDLALERAERYWVPSDRDHFLDALRKAGLPE